MPSKHWQLLKTRPRMLLPVLLISRYQPAAAAADALLSDLLHGTHVFTARARTDACHRCVQPVSICSLPYHFCMTNNALVLGLQHHHHPCLCAPQQHSSSLLNPKVGCY